MGKINADDLKDYRTLACVDCGMLNVVHRAFLDHSGCAYCGGRMEPVKDVVLQQENTIQIGVHITITED